MKPSKKSNSNEIMNAVTHTKCSGLEDNNQRQNHINGHRTRSNTDRSDGHTFQRNNNIQPKNVQIHFDDEILESLFPRFKKINGIIELDKPKMRPSGDSFDYYCKLCEVNIRREYQVREHLFHNVEHKAYMKRKIDRADLSNLFRHPSQAHIRALDILCLSSEFKEEYDNNQQERDVQTIRDAVQRSLEEEFGFKSKSGDVDIVLTGSILTGMHRPNNDTCDLNLFVKFSEKVFKNGRDELGPIFVRSQEAMKNVGHHLPVVSTSTESLRVSAFTTHYCPAMLQFTLQLSRYKYCVRLGFGPRMEQAHWSTRLVQAYLNIWPPLRLLIRFIRRWAQFLFLNKPEFGGVQLFVIDLLCIFYMQRTRYLPVLNEFISELQSQDSPESHPHVDNVEQLCRLPEIAFQLACTRLQSLYYGPRVPTLSGGQLLFGFFRFMATEFDEHSVCKLTTTDIEDREMNCHQQLLVLDPFLKFNTARFSAGMHILFWNCVLRTACYLCIPRHRVLGPLYEIKLEETEITCKGDTKRLRLLQFAERTLNGAWDCKRTLLDEDSQLVPFCFDELELPLEQCQFCSCMHCAHITTCNGGVSQTTTVSNWGHSEEECDLVAAAPASLLYPPICARLDAQLTAFIQSQYDRNCLGAERKREIFAYIGVLKQLLCRGLNADDIRLVPFGSLINGLGSNNCDLDLCLHSEGLKAIDVEGKKTIIEVGKVLRQELGCHTDLVLSAKVPIVKFKHEAEEFIGDISVGNYLGQRNSDMLRLYTEIDWRVAPLGLFIKQWAKSRSLNDASNGSFSSYSLIIMLIFFLQRGCDPSVLPNLQELADEEEQCEMIDGWEVKYRKDIDGLESSNKESLGALLRGFFRYYLVHFDPRFDVVQIRRSKRLFKMDKVLPDGKRWDQYTLCVEDPFELGHNLTGGVKGKVYALFIAELRETFSQLSVADNNVRTGAAQTMNGKLLNFLSRTGI